MHRYLERLNGLLGHLTLVVRGLRAVTLIFQVAAGLGALLTVLGFVRAGWWWWLGLLVGAVVAVPALALWRFRSVAPSEGRSRQSDAFNETSYGRVLGGVAVLHPAALMAGATSTVFAVGSLVFGLLVYLAGGVV